MRRFALFGMVLSAIALVSCAMAVLAHGSGADRSIRTLPTQERVVALTFDDGPDPRYTPEVLRILSEEDVPGTFFLIGTKVEADGERMDYSGHLVGYHTYSHGRMNRMPPQQQVAEFERGKAVLPVNYNTGAGYYRAPRGQAWPSTVSWADNQGEYLLWSVAYDKLIRTEPTAAGHRRAVMSHEDRVSALVSRVKPGDVILMHDGNDNGRYLVQDLPDIVRELRARGFCFATPEEFRSGGRKTPVARADVAPATRGR